MCNITLNQPTIDSLNGNTILRLAYSGTAQDCSTIYAGPQQGYPVRLLIDISIIVNGQPDPNLHESQIADVNSLNPDYQRVANGGLWSWGRLTKQLPPFPCGSTVRIRVSCAADPTCFVERDFVINCDACPSIELELTNVSPCNNGLTAATFEVTVTNPVTPAAYEIEFGDNESDSYSFHANENPKIITHDYSNDGTFSAIVNSIIPENCPSSNSVRVVIPPCNNDNCPSNIDFEIIDGNGNRFRVVNNNGTFEAVANNPLHQQVNCLPSGRYTLRVTSPSGAGLTFVWREDENAPIENNSRDFAFSLTNGEDKTINVIVQKDGCTDLPESVRIRECGGGGGGKQDCEFTEDRGPCINGQRTVTVNVITPASNGGNPCPSNRTERCTTDTPPTFCDPCCWWFIANVVLTIAAIVAVIIAGCVFQWAEPISMTTAIVLVIASIISWILWCIFCLVLNPIRPSCQPLLLFIEFLDWVELVAGVIALVLAAIGQLPCAISFAVDWGLAGTLRRILVKFAQIVGCLPNPFFSQRR